MKTIGLIAGMSWESSLEYYRIINELVKARLGGLHSAKIVMDSMDFAEIEDLQVRGEWGRATELLKVSAKKLERAGADLVLIASNTMHRMAGDIQSILCIPLLHIADVTAAEIRSLGVRNVGLLGTAFTMEEDFYKGHLQRQHGLAVIVPEQRARQEVHDIIYQELCLGKIYSESREKYRRVMNTMIDNGAQAIILGCTEIGLLIKPEDSVVPLLDTTFLHARAAVDFALREE